MKSRRSRNTFPAADTRRPLQLEQLETRRLMAFNPTGDEQHFMQLVNRFRTDPAGEFSRLISRVSPLTARDPVLQTDLDYARVNGTVLRSEMLALKPTPPVAWNAAVVEFNQQHNQDMIRAGVHFHSNSQERFTALTAAGLQFAANGERILSENVYGYAKSVNHLFGAYVIDWNRAGPSGMAAERKHRVALHNPLFDQAGHAITRHTGSRNPPLGPMVNSQILVNLDNPPVFVTGAIFQDKNSSGWYEAGEGVSSVQFTFEDQAGNRFQTTGMTAGGYQVALPPGTYSATATGGGMRYPQRMSNIAVGSSNVWVNWIYDPDKIPSDLLEPNNSRSAATVIDSNDASFSSLSIHAANDHDYFRVQPLGSGAASFRIAFANSAGNLDLELLDASGAVIAESKSDINAESIEHSLERGKVYYLRVFGRAGATNGNYSLTTRLPPPAAPVAEADQAIFSGRLQALTIDVLANDRNPDGAHSQLEPQFVSGTTSHFRFDAQRRVSYTPPSNFTGVHRAQYTLTNEFGLKSSPATVSIFVVDVNRELPWHNARSALDVNDDRSVTPIDALLVTNALNQASDANLPSTAAGAEQIFGFVDTNGDGFLSPIDVLLVVQQLNSSGSGEGEGYLPADDREQATDQALLGWAASQSLDSTSEKRKSRFADWLW